MIIQSSQQFHRLVITMYHGKDDRKEDGIIRAIWAIVLYTWYCIEDIYTHRKSKALNFHHQSKELSSKCMTSNVAIIQNDSLMIKLSDANL